LFSEIICARMKKNHLRKNVHRPHLKNRCWRNHHWTHQSMNHYCFSHCFRHCCNFRYYCCLPVHYFCNYLNLKQVHCNFWMMFRYLNFCYKLNSTCSSGCNLKLILVANNRMLNYCLVWYNFCFGYSFQGGYNSVCDYCLNCCLQCCLYCFLHWIQHQPDDYKFHHLKIFFFLSTHWNLQNSILLMCYFSVTIQLHLKLNYFFLMYYLMMILL
jgi:hypothetical protein